jgi:RNA polymerase sigma-70 factor (ECF subfamily)
VIPGSRSASFSGRAGQAAAHSCVPALSSQKRKPRFSTYKLANSDRRSSGDTRLENKGMEAFEEMVKSSHSRFLALANAILRNREDAEDAVQDAFLSGYLHLPSFEGRSALTTWFTRIVLNAALMIRRKRKSTWMNFQPETSTSDDATRMESIPTSQPDPETVYAEIETIQFVNDVIRNLKPALRQAITATYYDELSCPEACALLNLSSASFKSRLLRARRVLKQAQRNRVAPIGQEWAGSTVSHPMTISHKS